MKNRTFFNWVIIFLGVVAIVGFCFIPALAEEELVAPIPGVQSEDNFMNEESIEDFGTSDESFGQNYQYTWIPYAAFTPLDSPMTYSQYANYRYRTGGGYYMVAPINLPNGAYLYSAQLFLFDNDSDFNVYAWVYRHSLPNNLVILDSCYSSGYPGHSYCTAYCNETIQNGNNMYVFRVGLSAANINNGFMGVRLYWRRQISPAPATATFNDVGTGHWAFKQIEALAASGITVGCGAGNFCPNVAVTRAQMAVFLARALGLHWGPFMVSIP